MTAEKLRNGFEQYTREFYLSSPIRPQDKDVFIEQALRLSGFIRNELFRAQLFDNFFLVNNKELAHLNYMFKNFWYTISQHSTGV